MTPSGSLAVALTVTGSLAFGMTGECERPVSVGPRFAMARLLIAPGVPFREETRPELLGGVVVLKHAGKAFVPSSYGQPLYAPAAALRGVRPAELTFIPYYAWANRWVGQMAVWLPRK